jgi:MinD-like ATPase involved in chromosome partitioning or flagellar assembly
VICVLMMASGAAWESEAFARLDAQDGVVVLKRCVDVDDLLATATSGQADVAVVGLEAPGLDPAAVAHLRRYAVRPVAVVPRTDDPDVLARAQRIDVRALVAFDDPDALARAVTTVEDVADTRVRPDATLDPLAPAPDESRSAARHRLVVVWGPGGAPGRTTTAVTMAAVLARRGRETVLVDADPYGGGVAQQLGILDEVSGILSAARLAGSGHLAERFASTCRGVGDRLRVVTGLPRADRWIEVRGSAVEQTLEVALAHGDVVVDTGFGLEDEPGQDFGSRPSRNAMTLTALDLADEVVVVGSADPVGLSRLARGLVELRDRTGGAPVRVVVTRMRPTLGWSEREIAGMVEGFSRVLGLHFLPDDRAATDRALVAGRALPEVGDSALLRGYEALVDAVFPESLPDRETTRATGRRPGRGTRRAMARTRARRSPNG